MFETSLAYQYDRLKDKFDELREEYEKFKAKHSDALDECKRVQDIADKLIETYDRLIDNYKRRLELADMLHHLNKESLQDCSDTTRELRMENFNLREQIASLTLS